MSIHFPDAEEMRAKILSDTQSELLDISTKLLGECQKAEAQGRKELAEDIEVMRKMVSQLRRRLEDEMEECDALRELQAFEALRDLQAGEGEE